MTHPTQSKAENDAPSGVHPLLRRLRLEPWGVEYMGSVHSASTATDLGEAGEVAVGQDSPLKKEALEIETPLADWRPLSPCESATVRQVMFIDGVQRIEARLFLEEAPTVFGALGSCAVAAVVSGPLDDRSVGREVAGGRGRAVAEYVGEPVVQRWLALGGGRSDLGEAALLVTGGGQRAVYQVATDPKNDKDSPVRALHAKMLEAERDLAARLLPQLGEGLLLCDGPRPQLGADQRVLGYLKTVHAQRLPDGALEAVRALKEGQRSPLYVVGEGEFARFEWYLRLRDPGPWMHTLAGSVRLQAYAGNDPLARLEWTRTVADWSCVNLPRFATRTHQDPRAPQQLLPVRALEQTLRRRLGSAPLLRRRMVATLSAVDAQYREEPQ